MSSCTQNRPSQAGNTVQQPATATVPEVVPDSLAVATFASGCFWCSEGVFEQIKGVQKVVSGYSGGDEKNPDYRQVSSGETGHAESIQIFYDPEIISYRGLLEVFFTIHDPTTLNRQGPDVGKHYRSAIFYRTEEELREAKNYIRELNNSGTFNKPIVTEVTPFTEFWVAEEFHQNYYLQNPADPYMRSVFQPKLKKVQKELQHRLKE